MLTLDGVPSNFMGGRPRRASLEETPQLTPTTRLDSIPDAADQRGGLLLPEFNSRDLQYMPPFWTGKGEYDPKAFERVLSIETKANPNARLIFYLLIRNYPEFGFADPEEDLSLSDKGALRGVPAPSPPTM